MCYQSVDRPPALVLEPYENDVIARWYTEGLPADEHPTSYLGLDQILTVPINLTPLPAFEQCILSETAEEIIQIDVMGNTVRRQKTSPSMYYGHIDHPVKNLDDWHVYRQRFRLDSDERQPKSLETIVSDLNASPQPVFLTLFPFFFRLGLYTMGLEGFMTA